MSVGYYNCRRLSRVIRKDVLFLLLGPPAVVFGSRLSGFAFADRVAMPESEN